MTVWHIVLISAIAVLALKLSGYLVPPSLLEKPRVSRTSALLTVALLAALVGVQTFTTGNAIVLDARVPAIGVAAVLLAVRAPFIIVVVAAAATAALLRLWWP